MRFKYTVNAIDNDIECRTQGGDLVCLIFFGRIRQYRTARKCILPILKYNNFRVSYSIAMLKTITSLVLL